MSQIEFNTKRDALLDQIRSLGSCAVAFSGGVDSAVVAQAAQLALEEDAVAVTGVSHSLAPGELNVARDVARQIGIRHVEVETEEFGNPDYVQNDARRCFHCKTELYTHLTSFCQLNSIACILNGANVDDQDDYRPGMEAARNFQVISPLAECGLNKTEVRQLAAQWNLPVWDKPASPCLSSRVAYGEEVTPERLRMIDEAECFLREQGLREVRVRYHRGDLARIEMPVDSIYAFLDPQRRASIADFLRSLGFRFVTIDLEGFRSGSLNSLVSIDQIKRL
jgi:uncharacterized protein